SKRDWSSDVCSSDLLNAPASRRVDSFWPGVAASPSGKVYMSAYAADVVSPWQTCTTPDTPTAVGRINCITLGSYIHNARLDYVRSEERRVGKECRPR